MVTSEVRIAHGLRSKAAIRGNGHAVAEADGAFASTTRGWSQGSSFYYVYLTQMKMKHIAQATVGVDLEAEDTRISVEWWVNKTGANWLSGVQDINGTF